MERFPSGQRGQTVNLLAQPSMVRIHPSPPPRVCELPGEPGLSLALKRVWFNGRTPAFQAGGAGSIPATRSSLEGGAYEPK